MTVMTQYSQIQFRNKNNLQRFFALNKWTPRKNAKLSGHKSKSILISLSIFLFLKPKQISISQSSMNPKSNKFNLSEFPNQPIHSTTVRNKWEERAKTYVTCQRKSIGLAHKPPTWININSFSLSWIPHSLSNFLVLFSPDINDWWKYTDILDGIH